MSSWKRIGRCAVDSGQMMLVDPCYVLPDNKEKVDSDAFSYDELLAQWEKEGWDSDYLKIADGLGFVTETGYGDGTYDVYIKMRDDRVAELKIVFIEEEDGWN